MGSKLPRIVTRVPEDINKKFLKICEIEDRSASNLLGILVKNYVENYEKDYGEFIIDEHGEVRQSNSRSG